VEIPANRGDCIVSAGPYPFIGFSSSGLNGRDPRR
jgi:hypothetical protein